MFVRPAPRGGGRRVEAGPVVGDGEGERAVHRRQPDRDARVGGVLGHVLQGFQAAEVHRDLDGFGGAFRPVVDDRDGDRAAARHRPQRRGQPRVAQQRRVDAVGEVAQLGDGLPRAAVQLVEQLEVRRVGAAGRRAAAAARPRARRGAAGRRRAGRARSAAVRPSPPPRSATRDACSSALLFRRSTRVAWSASSNARLRSSIASLPATAASARSSAPVNAAASAARSITTSPSTRLPSTAGAKRICGGSGVGGTSRGTHIRSQPGPATPTLASRPRSAADSGIAGGAPSSGAGTIVAHSRSPSSSLPGGPVQIRTLDSRQSRRIDSASGRSSSATGSVRRARSPTSASSSSGERRTPAERRARAAARSACPAAPRGRHEQHPEQRRVHQVDLRADRELAEGQQHEQQPEVDRDREAHEVRRRHQDRGARPPCARAGDRRRPEHDRQQRECHRHGERRPAAQQRDAHPDRRDPQPDEHPREEQRPRGPPPRRARFMPGPRPRRARRASARPGSRPRPPPRCG